MCDKIRKKGYVMNIRIELNDVSEVLNKFNSDMINQELDDYIISFCENKFFRKKSISLEVYGIKSSKDREIFQDMIHNHYKNKVNFYSKLDKFDDYYRLCLLILGIVAILLSENFVSFLSELFLIAGWVVIWEIVYDVIFNEIRRKRKENIYKKLANSDIIFIDK